METPLPTGAPENPTVPPPAIAGDAETEALLRRHAAGEKLTQSEFGKVGAFRAKLARAAGKIMGRPAGADAPPAVAQDEPPAPDDCASVPPVDSNLVRGTTATLLSTCDKIAQNYLRAEATKAGADTRTAGRIGDAVALTPENKALLVDTSPALFQSLGISPANYPAAVFLAGLGAWAAGIASAVAEVKQLAATKPTPPTPAAPAP